MSMQITFCSTKNIRTCPNSKKWVILLFKLKVFPSSKRIGLYASMIFYIPVLTKWIEWIRRKIMVT
jgi:hypothetical protein